MVPGGNGLWQRVLPFSCFKEALIKSQSQIS